MTKEVVASIISGGVAVFAAILALGGQFRMKRLEVRMEAEKTARKFREPLGQAAYDLQSRIYNLVNSNFLNDYLRNGDRRTRSYAIRNTLFVIAQYLAWTELVRREIQFIDLGADEDTRSLARLRDEIYAIWQSNAYHSMFRIFAGEQRAIGERLIREGPSGPACMGYASFLDFYTKRPDPLLSALEAEIAGLGTSLPQALPRLVALQHALVDLLDFLDPKFVRFPEKNRTKLQA